MTMTIVEQSEGFMILESGAWFRKSDGWSRLMIEQMSDLREDSYWEGYRQGEEKGYDSGYQDALKNRDR